MHIIYSDGPSDETHRNEVIEKVKDIIREDPKLPLRFVAINFETIYEIKREGRDIESVTRSPRDWVTDPYITLFSQNLWEW